MGVRHPSPSLSQSIPQIRPRRVAPMGRTGARPAQPRTAIASARPESSLPFPGTAPLTESGLSSSRNRESAATSTSVGTSMRSSNSVEQGKKIVNPGEKVDTADRFLGGRVVGGGEQQQQQQGQQVVLGKSEVVAIKLRGRDKAIRPR